MIDDRLGFDELFSWVGIIFCLINIVTPLSGCATTPDPKPVYHPPVACELSSAGLDVETTAGGEGEQMADAILLMLALSCP